MTVTQLAEVAGVAFLAAVLAAAGPVCGQTPWIVMTGWLSGICPEAGAAGDAGCGAGVVWASEVWDWDDLAACAADIAVNSMIMASRSISRDTFLYV